MISFEQALESAKQYVLNKEPCAKIELAIMPGETIHFEYGWVFFYHTRKFVEEGDESVMLGGNGPIIVDNRTGKITATGTARDTEYYIERYRSEQGQ